MILPIMSDFRYNRSMSCWACLTNASGRNILKRHLAKVIPTVAVMEQLKEKIKLNGHFKDLPGFNL